MPTLFRGSAYATFMKRKQGNQHKEGTWQDIPDESKGLEPASYANSQS